MKFIIILLFGSLFISCAKTEKNVELNIDLLNSMDNTFCLTFSKKKDEVYYTKARGIWGKEKLKSSIFYTKLENNAWTQPVKLLFDKRYNFSSPHLTSDDKRLYFISDQPIKNDSSSNIWYVERQSVKAVWSKPQILPFTINSEYSEYSPKSTPNGDLYFASRRPGGFGQGDLYVSKNNNGILSQPINLGSAINSDKGEWNLELSDDGEILIFEASQRPENKSSFGDLYISFKKNDSWTKPLNLKDINTTGSDLYPTIIGDKLYYSSSDSIAGPRTSLYVTSLAMLIQNTKKSMD